MIKIRESIVDWLLVLAGLIIMFLLPHEIYGDAGIRVKAMESLLAGEGFPSIKYSLLGSLFSSPLFLLERFFGLQQGGIVVYYNTLLIAGFILFVALQGRKKDQTPLFALLVVSASMFMHHSRHYYGEVFSTVTASAGIILLSGADRVHSRARAICGSVLLVLASVNLPATIPALFLLALFLMWSKGRRLRYFLLPASSVALVFFENWLRFSSPFENPYQGDSGFSSALPYSGLAGFSYPFFFGLYSVLLSAGKGLVFFAPGLVAFVYCTLTGKQRRNENPASGLDYSMLVYLSGMILAYAGWWSWYGGWFWGPRFFLFASIPSALGLVWLHEKPGRSDFLFLVLLALSLWVSLSGAVFGQSGLTEICAANRFALEAFCWYVPELSVLWYPFVQMKTLTSLDWLVVVYHFVVFLWLSLPTMGRLASSFPRYLPPKPFSGWRF